MEYVNSNQEVSPERHLSGTDSHEFLDVDATSRRPPRGFASGPPCRGGTDLKPSVARRPYAPSGSSSVQKETRVPPRKELMKGITRAPERPARGRPFQRVATVSGGRRRTALASPGRGPRAGT